MIDYTKQCSFKKVIRNDFQAKMYFLGIFVIWIVVIISLISQEFNKNYFVLFSSYGVFMFCFFIIALFIRIKYIKKISKNGIEIKASVLKICFKRGKGYIDFKYIFNNEEFINRNHIMLSMDTYDIRNDDKLDIIMDPNNPKKALIKDLFI